MPYRHYSFILVFTPVACSISRTKIVNPDVFGTFDGGRLSPDFTISNVCLFYDLGQFVFAWLCSKVLFFARFKESKWRSKRNNNLVKPSEIRKTAFLLAIENDWPGVAYSILEDGALILLDAFRVCVCGRI